jgi:hypothetical protein
MPTNPPLSFQEFVQSLTGAEIHHFAATANFKAAGDTEFAEMKAHLVQRYQGINARHTFVDDHGQIFDCIPIEQQPGAKASGGQIATPPELPGAHPPAGTAHRPQLSADRQDPFGNAMSCPVGTVPVRRITLEEMTRFKSLRHFFQKSPAGGSLPPRPGRTQIPGPAPEAPPAVQAHKYAHAYQTVPNLGGHSALNIWAPAVGNEVFSLAQQWYVGFDPVLQTAEVGWQVFPQKYQTTQPVLFIYWTADNYQNTGCYNLDCQAFVQTNPQWAIGGALPNVSTPGGPQFDLEVAFYLYQGNWWLYLSGQPVGYYRATQYGAGPMATGAAEIDYGGETVNTDSWPPMGSGAFASAGNGQAAYQRDIFYFPTAGTAVPATLTPQEPSPNCYTLQLLSGNAPWNNYFFFGGPGGNNC